MSRRRNREPADDYAIVGGQPSTQEGRRLDEDQRVRAAVDRQAAVAESPHTGHPPTVTPAVQTVVRATDEFLPYTWDIEPGTFLEILGRDPGRTMATVTNQSTDATALVLLARTEREAQQLAQAAAPPANGRFLRLPANQANRDINTRAPVFAVCVKTAAVGATVDVVAERVGRE